MTLVAAPLLPLAYEPSQVKPGYIALFIVLALAVATFFLMRSMLKRVKGIDFDEHADDGSVPEQKPGERSSDGGDHPEDER